MSCTQSDFLPELCKVKVRATSDAFCPGSSTAVTASSDPAPCGLARWKNDTMTTMMSIPTVVSNSGLTGGRLRLAVPNSSAILIVGPRCGLLAATSAAEPGGGGGGGEGPGV